jgi:membrane protein DedA with SNARE-associated domain
MMQILGNMLLSLVGRYGYLAVFFGVALESTGIPVPGDALSFGLLAAVTGDQTRAKRGPRHRSS